MPLLLFNTLTRRKEPFEPLDPPTVGLYSCGPTVYSRAHLGNLRTYVFVDTLRRTLEANGFRVKHVMNITDVGHLTDDADEGEDKVERQAEREGRSALELARAYEAAFKADLITLNILEPIVWLRATEHIDEKIMLIQRLEAKGATYRTDDGIYFDTSTFPTYGALAKLDLKGLRPGARVKITPGKRRPADFALWKFTPPGVKRQMEWGSPWGRGFPGWHIECSAMSMKALGETIDIHTGGIDHLPVHHTNEIAQSETATGKPFVRYWLHGEFLIVDEARMGKSEGNALTLDTLRERGIDPLAYRFWLLQTHYRQKLTFSWEALNAAARGFDRLRQSAGDWNKVEPVIGCAEFEQRLLDAMNDDLNTPQALTILWELARSDYPPAAKRRSLMLFDRLLGLHLAVERKIGIPPEVERLIQEREAARTTGDWKTADVLRSKITEAGFFVEDTAEGPKVKPAATYD